MKALAFEKRYSFKILIALSVSVFIGISAVGLLSNYFYQSNIQAEIQKRKTLASSNISKEWLSITDYLENSSLELSQSNAFRSASQARDSKAMANLLRAYRFARVGVFNTDGSPLVSFQNSPDGGFRVNDTKASETLGLGLIDRLQVNRQTLEILQSEDSSWITFFQSFQVGDDRYFLKAVVGVKNSYFRKISENQGAWFYVSKDRAIPLFSSNKDLRGFLGAGSLEDNARIKFQGKEYVVSEKALKHSLKIGVLVDIDSLVTSIGNLHFTIFFLSLVGFLFMLPFLYFVAMKLAEPVLSLLQRLEKLNKDQDPQLIPVITTDEVGLSIKEINKLIELTRDTNSKQSSKDLEIVVLKQKNSNLKEDLSRVSSAYLSSRIYRRSIDSFISESHMCQSVVEQSKKFIGIVKELTSYLGENGQHRNFLRSHSIEDKIEGLALSYETLSRQNLSNGESLIDQLWFLDRDANKTSEQSLDTARLQRLLKSVFPKLKLEFVDIALSLREDDLLKAYQVMTAILVLIGKQSRDGNSLTIDFESITGTDFQSYQALSFRLESPVSFDLSELDSEGSKLLRVLDVHLSRLNWSIQFPKNDNSEVFRFEVKVDKDLAT